MVIQPRHAGDDRYQYYKPLAGAGSHQQLAVSSSVVSPTIPQGARVAKVYFRGEMVRVTFNGVDPVSGSTGITFDDGYEEIFSRLELEVMKLTRESADATVHFVYYS